VNNSTQIKIDEKVERPSFLFKENNQLRNITSCFTGSQQKTGMIRIISISITGAPGPFLLVFKPIFVFNSAFKNNLSDNILR
jgi:hypothetical protein